MESEDRTMKGI